MKKDNTHTPQEQEEAAQIFDRYRKGERDEIPEFDPDRESVGRYLFGQSYVDPREAARGQVSPNWTSYTTGRIAVRLFSRGLLGSTLFTLGTLAADRQLKGYQALGKLEATGKPLQYVARFFDHIYAKPIEASVRNYYLKAGFSEKEAIFQGKRAISFRHRVNFNDGVGEPGRSLGAEIVAITVGFAGGSIGDATGRNLSAVVDPNIQNSWEDSEGHISPAKLLKAVGRDAFQIITKNQGEDWAVALPYAYQMKWQRQGIDKMYRGFKHVSDMGLNGSAWRVARDGKTLISSYAKAGALDLQLRFTGYNWYTLMYRDLYDKIADVVDDYQRDGSTPTIDSTGNIALDAINGTAHLFRYITKSAIKATIYMTPAVPFFWMFRTPQSKQVQKGVGVYVDPDTLKTEKITGLFANELNGNTPHPEMNRELEPFRVKHSRGVFDRMLSPFGRVSQQLSQSLNKNLQNNALGEMIMASSEAKASEAGQAAYLKDFSHTFARAAAAYTPYMIAKAETALRWDRPQGADGLNGLDRAAYRFIDGISSLNLSETYGGLMDLREEVIRPPSNKTIQERIREKNVAARERYEREQKEKALLPEPDTLVSEISAVDRQQQNAAGQDSPRSAPDDTQRSDKKWAQRTSEQSPLDTVQPGAQTTIH